MCLGGHSRRFLQGLNVPIHHTGRNRSNLHITDNRIDIVGNQGRLAVIHGHAPLLFPVRGIRSHIRTRILPASANEEKVSHLLSADANMASSESRPGSVGSPDSASCGCLRTHEDIVHTHSRTCPLLATGFFDRAVGSGGAAHGGILLLCRRAAHTIKARQQIRRP